MGIYSLTQQSDFQEFILIYFQQYENTNAQSHSFVNTNICIYYTYVLQILCNIQISQVNFIGITKDWKLP